MKPPYWRCMACGFNVRRTRFPLRGRDRVPLCPKCGRYEDMDVVIGDEDDELDEDLVIYTDDEEE